MAQRSDHATSANMLAPIVIQTAADAFAICTQKSGYSSSGLSFTISFGSTPVWQAKASVT